MILRRSGIAEPRREAGSLLSFVLEKDKTYLIAYPEYELTQEETERFSEVLKRRAGREPFQHITGRQEFYGLDFFVSKDVLIPRPETEMLVEEAMAILSRTKDPRFAEVGVGSGCIAVSILRNLRSARAVGLDLSAEALRVAERNARTHGVFERLELEESNVFEALRNKLKSSTPFDLIVSNPPYIPAEDFARLQPEVGRFDPEVALTDGRDGLSIIRKIVRRSPQFLKPGGFLLLEIGIGQADEVRAMFAPKIWSSVEIRPDLQGIPRMVKGSRF